MLYKILHLQENPAKESLVQPKDLAQLKKSIISAFSKEISGLRSDLLKTIASLKKGDMHDFSMHGHQKNSKTEIVRRRFQ